MFLLYKRSLMAVFFYLLHSYNQVAAASIKSSVPPEFPNGLHSKYLQFIADKMHMPLDITPMPFGRRIIELEKGKLDLVVGLQRRSEEEDEVYYLFPAYEQLRHSLFVLKQRDFQLKTFNDLQNLSIGVTTHAKYYDFLLSPKKLTTVGVTSLRQKIRLLKKGRIDTFIHFRESTLPTLEKLGLDREIELAPYQPVQSQSYYVAISRHSHLMANIKQMTQIIEQAVATGEFSQIRRRHYSK